MNDLCDRHAAFLEDIIAHPDDDGVRLIYADWLEEHGGEPARADFIRVQCRLAKIVLRTVLLANRTTSDEVLTENKQEYEPLRHRAQDLLQRWEGIWCTSLPLTWYDSYTGTQRTKCGSPYIWRRGFIESVSLSGSDWLTLGDDLVKMAPIRRVRLTRWTQDDAERICDFPVGIGLLASSFLKTLGYYWPGIAFELPPCNPLVIFDEVADIPGLSRRVDRPAVFP